jgi:hypothetical protein
MHADGQVRRGTTPANVILKLLFEQIVVAAPPVTVSLDREFKPWCVVT